MSARVTKRRVLQGIVFIVAISVAFIAPMQSALAAPWDNRTFNSGESRTYFDNSYPYTLSYYYPALTNYVISSGLYVYNVNDMINYLVSKNRGPSGSVSERRDVAGSAFVVHTILGRNGDQANANGGRSVSDADFASLRSRLNAATINWNTTVCTDGVNTMSGISGGRVDILRDPDKIGTQHCEAGVNIVDSFGNVYNIFHRCANPVGDIQGIADVNFDLTPTITGSPNFSSGGSTGADRTSLVPVINNTGTTATTNTIQWRVVTFRILPGLGIPGGGTNGSIPEAHFGNGATAIASATGQTYPRNTTALSVAPQAIGDFPIGTRICYALSVQPITQSNGSWRHSTPFCVTIAKSPKAQVRGGDIRVGSNFVDQPVPPASTIITSQTRKSISGVTRTFGSWGEYAVTASGPITGIGSGSAFAGPGLATPTACSYTFLTISNATNGNCTSVGASDFGRYTTGRTFPNIASSYPTSASAPSLSGTVNTSSLNGTYRAVGDITLSAGTIPVGRSIIINTYDQVANIYRNVTINGNIIYTTDNLTNSNQIPQVIIIAGDIIISPLVSQVDAWLIARGTLNTCAGVARTTITTNSCNTPLTVNGPVMANQLQLWRTAGSNTGAGSGDPAEVFNLRPDAYLWGLSQSSKSGRLQTVYEKELPPRF